MAQRKGISTGTTAQRSIEEQGKLRFNTTTNLLEYYDGTTWKSIDAPPTVSSVSPSNLLSGDGTGNYTIVVTGSGFSSSVTAVLIASNGSTEITPDTVTRDSATQVTLVVAKNTANLTNANEPFDIKIINSSGLAATLADALSVDAQPVFSTAAGSLGTFGDGSRSGISVSAVAADPESGGDITYTLESGSLPAGLSLTSTSSGAVISGTADAVGSNTTSNFTIRAADVNSNTSDRAFSIIINAPVVESFTSSGTFSVPSGVSAVNVLVVAGGGGGGSKGGGGGAGGLLYRPGFTVTPGGTVTVTVGDGGAGSPGLPVQKGTSGQDSVFGTLTAQGGGGGGSDASPYNANNGGSGGGARAGGGGIGTAGAGLQSTQPGDSGTYGFGNAGGNNRGCTPLGSSGCGPRHNGGGGGGAGTAGSLGGNLATSAHPCGPGPGPSSQGAGDGGRGKAYTIADGTTSVYYAGGGGGGGDVACSAGKEGQGGGGHGGGQSTNSQGSNGTANRGGGGGGGGNGPNPGFTGGKGIVIVTY
jgi:hypothetical protein